MRLAGLLPLLIVAVLCAALVSACGSGETTSSGGASNATTAVEPATESAPEPAGSAPRSAEPPGAAARACGSHGLKATGVGCGEARAVAASWRAAPGCAVGTGDSHASCRVRGYLCIGAAVGHGTAVSCALPHRSIVFLQR